MCQLYCPERSLWVVRIVSESTTSASNERVFTRVVWGIPGNCGVVPTLHTAQKSQQQKIIWKIQPCPKLQTSKKNIKAPHQLHQTHVLVWIFPWSKVIALAGFWHEESHVNLRYYRHLLTPLKSEKKCAIWQFDTWFVLINPRPPETPPHPLKRGLIFFPWLSPTFSPFISPFSDKALHHLGHSHFEVFLRHMLTSLAQGEHSSLGTKVHIGMKKQWKGWDGATLKESWIVCMIKSWPVHVTEHDRGWYRYTMVWGGSWSILNNSVMIYSHIYLRLKSPKWVCVRV